MDPAPPAMHDGVADPAHADVAVVITADGENWSSLPQLINERTQLVQLGRVVHQVTAEQHHVGLAAGHRLDDLPAQEWRTTFPQVNVADIQQPAGVSAGKQSLLTDVQRLVQADLERPPS